MESGDNLIITWLLGIGLFLVFVPPIVWMAVRKIQRDRRRKLVDSPRKIRVVTDEAAPAPAACQHERSRRRAYEASDGTYRSVCRKCGAPMKRLGPGEWVVED